MIVTNAPLARRAFLSSGAALALGGSLAGRPDTARAANPDQGYRFEITRTDAEWRARLSEEEYKIMRKGATELPNTSPLAAESGKGIYSCKGCDLTVYRSKWKVPLDMGWAFFGHSEPRAVLTSIDGEAPMGDDTGSGAMIEVHCRRCGSHLGHIVHVQNVLVHCINGTSLVFAPARA